MAFDTDGASIIKTDWTKILDTQKGTIINTSSKKVFLKFKATKPTTLDGRFPLTAGEGFQVLSEGILWAISDFGDTSISVTIES